MGVPTFKGGYQLPTQFGKNLYVKMNELGPLGGAFRVRPPWICH